MSWTKQALVEEAYSELGLAFYNYDLDPEELETGKRRLNAMWAMFESKGVRKGFNFAGELGDDSGLPDDAIEATVCNLALRIAPGKGKTVTPDTQNRASEGLLTLTRQAAMPPLPQYPSTLPRGAGNKPWRRMPYGAFNQSPDTGPIQTSPGGDLDLE